MQIIPVRDDRLKAIELWDVQTPYGPLWQYMGESIFPSLVLGVLERLQRGELKTASHGLLAAQSFDAVYLCGGAALGFDFEQALSSLAQPIFISPEPVFSGVKGGLEYLSSVGSKGAAIDVGQTQIKLADNSRQQVIARELEHLPLLLPEQAGLTRQFEDENMLRQRFIHWLAQVLSRFHHERALHGNMALALPCEILEQGGLGACSYFPQQEDYSLIEELFQFSSFLPDCLYLFNDAQMAALELSNELRLKEHSQVLVLSLGYAIGGALLRL